MTDVGADGADRGQPSAGYTGRVGPQELAQTLGHVARSLQDENTFATTLDGIVAAAVQTIPGARHAVWRVPAIKTG